MNRLGAPLLALLVTSGAVPVLAQNPPAPRPAIPGQQAAPGQIRGSVVDTETGKPLPSAAVAVWSKADNTLVTGAMVSANGTFRVEGLRPGTYYLKVNSLGYAPVTGPELAVTPAALQADAGAIRLSRSAVAIEGIEVTAERSAVAIAPDRNTYRAKDVAPAGGTATDVLQAVPSVEVDADGKVSLRGNENVAVQINGRPAPIRGTQLAGFLKQLPANMVERVEVVPNPSAKYDPEGMAGIINIVLKENTDLGVSGGFTLGAATAERYNASGNLGYQRGPFTSFVSYGFNSDERRITGINDRERLGAGRTPLSFTEQDIAGNAANAGHNLNTTVDYRLSKRDVLSNSLLLNRRSSSDASLMEYTELNGTRFLMSRYDRTRDAETEGMVLDYTLAFKRTLEPQRHELSTELRFNRSANRDATQLWRQPLTASGQIDGGRLEAETNETDALSHQVTAQADYTRTLGERTKLETGYKGTGRWLDNDFQVRNDALGTGVWVRSDLSNTFDFEEQVHAVYGVMSRAAGKFDLQAGLRAEHANRDFALADSAESFPYTYGSFFPSGLVSYKLNDASQVKLSYSRRIRRPGTQELNPFPVFFDLQNVFLGNPNLNPEYTDAFELGLQRSWKMGSMQLSPFYRRTTDVIRFIIDTDANVAGREVTSISFKNLATGSSWGTDVNGSLRLGPIFSGFGSFNIYKMVTEGTGGESSLSSDAVAWSARFNGTMNVSPKTSLQAMYFYRAPMNIERGRFSSTSMANFSVRHKLQGDKASVALRVSDPFNTMQFRVQAGDDNITQITERKFDTRAVHLTFQYNFGQAPKLRQPRRDQPAEPSSSFPQ
ncbi:TonB-dependent receptor [soil metagenome]